MLPWRSRWRKAPEGAADEPGLDHRLKPDERPGYLDAAADRLLPEGDDGSGWSRARPAGRRGLRARLPDGLQRAGVLPRRRGARRLVARTAAADGVAEGGDGPGPPGTDRARAGVSLRRAL